MVRPKLCVSGHGSKSQPYGVCFMIFANYLKDACTTWACARLRTWRPCFHPPAFPNVCSLAPCVHQWIFLSISTLFHYLFAIISQKVASAHFLEKLKLSKKKNVFFKIVIFQEKCKGVAIKASILFKEFIGVRAVARAERKNTYPQQSVFYTLLGFHALNRMILMLFDYLVASHGSKTRR